MLTQAMPALVKALDGVLPPEALKQLTQALGNCNQPLTSRAGLNVQSPTPLTDRGVIVDPPWDPNRPPNYPPDYPPLFPESGPDNYYVDVPGWSGPGAWNTNNYAGNSFNFATPQYFNSSNYYGAPTFNVGGNSFFDTVNTTNINVSQINGQPAPGPAGATGPSGPPGAAGRDAEVPDFALALMANLRFIRHLPPNLANVIVSVQAKDRLPTQAFGNVTADGVPTVTLPGYTVPAGELAAEADQTVEIEIPFYTITGDITLAEDAQATLALNASVSLPTTAKGTITLSEDASATLPVTGKVPIPTTATGTVSLSEEASATLPVTGKVPIPTTADGTITLATDTSETPTMEWTVNLPKWKFDAETCELTMDVEDTEAITITLPKWVVSGIDLTLGDATDYTLTDVTVPKLKADEASLTLQDYGSATVSGTVPKLYVQSYTLALSEDGTTPVDISIPAYSLPELTATADDDTVDVDMTPVSYTFTGIPTAQRYVTDIVVKDVPAPATPVFTP